MLKQWLIKVGNKCAICFIKKLLLVKNKADGKTGQVYNKGGGNKEKHKALGILYPVYIQGIELY